MLCGVAIVKVTCFENAEVGVVSDQLDARSKALKLNRNATRFVAEGIYINIIIANVWRRRTVVIER